MTGSGTTIWSSGSCSSRTAGSKCSVSSGQQNEQDPDLWFDRIHDDDKSDFQTKLRALMIGAEPELVADFRMRHNDGGFRWVRARGVARRNEEGDAVRVAGSLADITRERLTDSLTRLPNRSATVELFERVLSRAARTKSAHLIATLTIDQLRQVQEGLGQAKAQELSRITADRLVRAVRPDRYRRQLRRHRILCDADQCHEHRGRLARHAAHHRRHLRAGAARRYHDPADGFGRRRADRRPFDEAPSRFSSNATRRSIRPGRARATTSASTTPRWKCRRATAWPARPISARR